MDTLLQFITSLRNKDVPPSDLYKLFADRTRERYKACATALICTEGLEPSYCRVLSFHDHLGNTIVENQDYSQVSGTGETLHDDQWDKILDPARPIIHHGQKPGIHPLFGGLFHAYVDAVSLPLFEQRGVYRWMLLLFAEKGQIDAVDVERSLLLSTMAINYAVSVQDAKRLEKANAWIERELESVARIQRLLLPQDLDNTPGIKVACHFKPHAHVGGDYYDITRLSNILGPDGQDKGQGIWGLIVADASGHGAAAAVEIAMFDAILRTYKPDRETGPGGVFNYANRYFFTRMLRGGFITAFVSSYHPDSNRLHYSNAGHLPPLIKRANGEQLVTVDASVGIPLGVTPDFHWESAEAEMFPDDLLILYTDGICEAKSEAGTEFGVEQLVETIQSAPQDADACLRAITSTLEAHRGRTEQSDDQTLLVVQPGQNPIR